MVLDNLREIKSIDKGNMLESILDFPNHIKETIEEMDTAQVPEEYASCKNIVVVGMGGSGIPGDYLYNICFPECSIPVWVHKDYGLPAFVNEYTLVFAISYTGTTEETLDAYSEALARKAKIFGISSGDKLLARLKEDQKPYFKPPPGKTTRECLGYLIFSMIKVLEKLNFIPNQDLNISTTISRLEKQKLSYAPEIGADNNEAKAIATKLFKKIPILYGSFQLTDVVGLRWKHQLNENSKIFPHFERFPDVTHNQLAATVNTAGLQEELVPIFLRNKNESPMLSKRIDATKRVCFYLAMLNGVDPTPTNAMSELKRILQLTDLTPR